MGSRPVTTLREEKEGEALAQYVMAIDKTRASLALGLSIEKGEETRAAIQGRKMDRRTWDWDRLSKLRAPSLDTALKQITQALGRPVGVWVSTHVIEGGEETDREECDYILADGRWSLRARPSSAEELVAKIQNINKRKDWWADIWFYSDLSAKEVAKLLPEDAADLLFTFHPLRMLLRGGRVGRS